MSNNNSVKKSSKNMKKHRSRHDTRKKPETSRSEGNGILSQVTGVLRLGRKDQKSAEGSKEQENTVNHKKESKSADSTNPSKSSDERTTLSDWTSSTTNTAKSVGVFGRTVKEFVSRPLTDDNVKNFMTNVKSKSTTPVVKSVRFGEDVFVSMKNRKRIATVIQTDSPSDDSSINVIEDAEDGRGLLPVNTNFNNCGVIMEKGKPFWQLPSIVPDEEDMKGIEETKEMNAQSIVDVSQGKLKLKSMPTAQIVIDPFDDIDTLKARDASYFNLDVIFGNTIRSMINTINDPLCKKTEKSRQSTRMLRIVEPTKVRYYDKKTRKPKGEGKFIATPKTEEPK